MEFEIKNNVLVRYHEQEGKTDVIILDGVIEIGNSAFKDCKNIVSITIPESVTVIGTNTLGIYTNDVNVYSPNVFNMVDYRIKIHILISLLKNYLSGKMKYKEFDMNEFKKYIIINRIQLIDGYVYIYKVMD